KFNELRHKIKEDVLKRALFEMAVSPESFFNLRANFARSLMAMNVACWILGIGDRHMENVLIDRSNGRVAGVDFGIAFGAATRDRQNPEMVPFRLTPQFVSVMEPMRTAGLMRKSSVYTLACLRRSWKLLKSSLEVFVREPTLDWLEAARYRFQQDENKAAFAWDPQTRINIAIRKLNGANPKVLVAEELRLGQVAQNPEYLAGYLKLLQVSVPNLAEGNLSVEQQVECLLQMATSNDMYIENNETHKIYGSLQVGQPVMTKKKTVSHTGAFEFSEQRQFGCRFRNEFVMDLSDGVNVKRGSLGYCYWQTNRQSWVVIRLAFWGIKASNLD
ncbi:hypothetical protein pipiens_019428, partial [Culex pipiens pipiens]